MKRLALCLAIACGTQIAGPIAAVEAQHFARKILGPANPYLRHDNRAYYGPNPDHCNPRGAVVPVQRYAPAPPAPVVQPWVVYQPITVVQPVERIVVLERETVVVESPPPPPKPRPEIPDEPEALPALTLTMVDRTDPVRIGDPAIYIVRVTNQGDAEATNVGIAFDLPPEVRYIDTFGETRATASGPSIRLAPMPRLAPRETARWTLGVEALEPADIRVSVTLTSDDLQEPVTEAEPTRLVLRDTELDDTPPTEPILDASH